MKYSAWGKDGIEFTLVEGDRLPEWDTPGMCLLRVFEAESYNDAMQQYYEWQGWGLYRPMDD